MGIFAEPEQSLKQKLLVSLRLIVMKITLSKDKVDVSSTWCELTSPSRLTFIQSNHTGSVKTARTTEIKAAIDHLGILELRGFFPKEKKSRAKKRIFLCIF